MLGKDGRPKRYSAERTEQAGSVWADDRAAAQKLAEAYFGPNATVQSAASATISREVDEVVKRERRPVRWHRLIRPKRKLTPGSRAARGKRTEAA